MSEPSAHGPRPPDRPREDDLARALEQRWRHGPRPDVHDVLAAAGTLTPAQVLAVLRVDQRERWRRGERLPAEAYLLLQPALREDPEHVVELVYGEILLREERGEAPALEEYADRFPQHADRLRMQLEVHQALRPGSSLNPAGTVVGPGPGSELPLFNSSVLESLRQSVGFVPQVLLRDPPDDTSPVVKPGAEPALTGRYQLLGEIARGGMGAVLKGRDTDLGRDLALKVLLERHRGRADVVRRFVEEAQIGGQLQHPGIVPVYELGQFPDRRPYFTMKLVKGRTLAALLEARPDPAQDRPRFLAVFERVCQAVAYAHSRGVVHRDLKPANVMVGAFGEVQVMDWGLAKVLAEGGAADEDRARRADEQESVVRTVRSGSSAAESQTGSVLGTPAYMAPEQARGAVEDVDERADVFGLGAILCEVLTGKPPYVGRSGQEVYRKACAGDLADALARLAACGADEDLLKLARSCLAAEPFDRPRDARAVARAVTAYQASVQERLRAAELARAAAQAKAAEERRTRRRTLALAASVLVTVLLGGGGWWWVQQDRAARALARAEQEAETERVVNDALAKAALLQEQGKWPEARAAVQRADDLLAGGGPAPLRQRAADLRADLDMVERLEEARLPVNVAKGSRFDHEPELHAYAAAFRDHDINVVALEPAEAAARIRRRAVREHLIAALDDWARNADPKMRERLRAVVGKADTDGWRTELRAVLAKNDKPTLKRLAGSVDVAAQPPATLMFLGEELVYKGEVGEAVAVLRKAQRQYPLDFWINHQLAHHLLSTDPPQVDESVRYFTVAVALRPQSPGVHLNLGYALDHKRLTAQAADAYREAIRLKPDYAEAHNNLGAALHGQNLPDEAIKECRKALDLDPNLASAHHNLGSALIDKKEYDRALEAFQTASRLAPTDAFTHFNRGRVLEKVGRRGDAIKAMQAAAFVLKFRPGSGRGVMPDEEGRSPRRSLLSDVYLELSDALAKEGRLDEALAVCDDMFRLDPDDYKAHYNRGHILYDMGRVDEAIAAYKESARRCKKDDGNPFNNLGVALDGKGLDAAVFLLEEALHRDKANATAHLSLGNALRRQGRLDEAAREYRAALRLKEDYVDAHIGLGNVSRDQGLFDDAACQYDAALHHAPDDPLVHFDLGLALREQGRLDEAVACFREALDLKRRRGDVPPQPLAPGGGFLEIVRRKLPRPARGDAPALAEVYYQLGAALAKKGALDDAVRALREATRLQEDHAFAHLELGGVFLEKQALDDAIKSFEKARKYKPNAVEAHGRLAEALHARGRHDEAVAAYRQAVRLKPRDPAAVHNLGVLLRDLGERNEVLYLFREAARLDPDYAMGQTNLGVELQASRRYDEAVAAFQKAIRLEPNNPIHRLNLGSCLSAKGDPRGAIAAYKEALAIDKDFAPALRNLGIACLRQGLKDDAIAAFRRLTEVAPENADAHNSLGAALEGKGRLQDALVAYREAVRLDKNHANAHLNLGYALARLVGPDEGLPALRRAVSLRPQGPEFRFGLGMALASKGDLDGAAASLREAIRLAPLYADAYFELGAVLQRQGQFARALAALQQGHDLGSASPDWPYPSAQVLRQAERRVELNALLPAVLKGRVKPAGAAERIELAQVCQLTQRHAAAARFYEEAFADKPPLAEDTGAGHRYNAARAAALAGVGRGKDDPPPDADARKLWRDQALDWLRADLALWVKRLEGPRPPARADLERLFRSWKADPDLAGVRDEAALAKLPDDERKAYVQFWADVDALLLRVKEKK